MTSIAVPTSVPACWQGTIVDLDERLRQDLGEEIDALACAHDTDQGEQGNADSAEFENDERTCWYDEYTDSTSLGYAEDSLFDTMPIYNMVFHLVQDPQSGIFHSSNPVRLCIDLLHEDHSIKGTVELFVELIGGNFPSSDRMDGFTHQSPSQSESKSDSESPSKECCARLRIWTLQAEDLLPEPQVMVTSCFCPQAGLIVDGDGSPVRIENAGLVNDPARDTSQRWSSHRLNLPRQHPCMEGCSAFQLPSWSARSMFESAECFSLPSATFDEELNAVYKAIWVARNWQLQFAKLPENIVYSIALFLHLKRLCIRGIFAVGIGVIGVPDKVMENSKSRLSVDHLAEFQASVAKEKEDASGCSSKIAALECMESRIANTMRELHQSRQS